MLSIRTCSEMTYLVGFEVSYERLGLRQGWSMAPRIFEDMKLGRIATIITDVLLLLGSLSGTLAQNSQRSKEQEKANRLSTLGAD